MAISDDQKLQIYNGACRIVSEARLQSLTEAREARYLLDDVWANGGVQYCLEAGLWNFARRTAKLTYDVAATPNWGSRYAFEKPADWVRTMGVWQDEMLRVPYLLISDESGYFYAELQVLYLAYVSNDDAFGMNFGLWPQTFGNAVQGYFAANIVAKLAGSSQAKIDSVTKAASQMMEGAKNAVAMNQSAAFFPTGSWVRGRSGRWGGNADRGNTGQLIG